MEGSDGRIVISSGIEQIHRLRGSGIRNSLPQLMERSFAKGIRDRAGSQIAWRMTQTAANCFQHANSLKNREDTGIFHFDSSSEARKKQDLDAGFCRIPYLAERGIISVRITDVDKSDEIAVPLFPASTPRRKHLRHGRPSGTRSRRVGA
jgi:hypothetical protein